MTRTQKKCLIAAIGFHLLLLVLLVAGPAFLVSQPKMEEVNLLTFVPDFTTYEKAQGGGSPRGGTPPPPAPARPPQPTPTPQPRAEPPAAREAATQKEEPDSKAAATTRKVQPNLRRTTRSTGAKPAPEVAQNSASQPPARALSAHESTMRNLRAGLSTATSIDVPAGPGGGGATYANFYDAIGKVYYDAWVEPEVESSGVVRVEASVTIARSGEVLASRITKPSGNAAVDQSVQATLNRVRQTVPLPPDSNESQKVVPITFTAQIKKGTG